MKQKDVCIRRVNIVPSFKDKSAAVELLAMVRGLYRVTNYVVVDRFAVKSLIHPDARKLEFWTTETGASIVKHPDVVT